MGGRLAALHGSCGWRSTFGMDGATRQRRMRKEAGFRMPLRQTTCFCCEFAPYFYEAVKLRYPSIRVAPGSKHPGRQESPPGLELGEDFCSLIGETHIRDGAGI